LSNKGWGGRGGGGLGVFLGGETVGCFVVGVMGVFFFFRVGGVCCWGGFGGDFFVLGGGVWGCDMGGGGGKIGVDLMQLPKK